MEKQFEYCCTSFARKAMKLQDMAGGGSLYPVDMRPDAQFEPDDYSDTWNINGCCGYVVVDIKFCPYCGERLTNPLRPNEHPA